MRKVEMKWFIVGEKSLVRWRSQVFLRSSWDSSKLGAGSGGDATTVAYLVAFALDHRCTAGATMSRSFDLGFLASPASQVETVSNRLGQAGCVPNSRGLGDPWVPSWASVVESAVSSFNRKALEEGFGAWHRCRAKWSGWRGGQRWSSALARKRREST